MKDDHYTLPGIPIGKLVTLEGFDLHPKPVNQPWQLNPTYRALRKAGLQRTQPSLIIPSFEKDFL